MGAEWSSLPRVGAKYLSIHQEKEIVEFPFVEIVFRRMYMLSDRLGNNLTKDRPGQ